MTSILENDYVGFGGGYLNPDWSDIGRVHDWRNYVSDELRKEWENFTPYQRKLIALNADKIAGQEEWE